ncbi:MAG: efflux RND transporter periplasmic adaptor subunit [Acidobacteriota bacterium]
MKRRTKIIIGSIVVAIIAAVVIVSIQYSKPKGKQVRTTKVEKKNLTSLVTANGTIQARTKVELSANIMGQITELNVEEGMRVKKGDLLLVIDQTRYAAAVDSRRWGLKALEAELVRSREATAQARRDLERIERQFHEKIIPEAEYDRAKSLYDQNMATEERVERQVAQAKAELAAAEDELTKTEIRAPMDGIVTRRNVERGEVVVTGTMNNPGTVLMTISDMASVEAELEVDQTDVPLLRIGQKASVLIDAFPDTSFPGVVSEIGSSPIQGLSALGGSATGTDYKVKVALTEHPEQLRPGLTVTADIETGRRENVLAIPMGALVLRDEEEKNLPDAKGEERQATEAGKIESVASRARDVEGVYIVENGKAVFRKVKTGIKGELDVEALEGLKEGEEIIVGPFSALRELKPGDKITVNNTLGAGESKEESK